MIMLGKIFWTQRNYISETKNKKKQQRSNESDLFSLSL